MLKILRHRHRVPLAPVSLGSGSVVLESRLPFPWVKYPQHYGTFMAFAQNKAGPWFFCRCAEGPLRNLVELLHRYPIREDDGDIRRAPLPPYFVPLEFATLSRQHSQNPVDALQFKPKLCHRCNLTAPSLRYCAAMYGGRYDQAYGWYTNQTRLRLGVRDLDYLPDVCPPQIADKIDTLVQLDRAAGPRPGLRMGGERAKLYRDLENDFINLTRAEFGFRKVGDGWISETMLATTVHQLYPNDQVLRHHRPDWLKGLELDVFLPVRDLAFEYQGQQHFYPIQAWGGVEALAELKLRDRRKARLCANRGVMLILIKYTDPITHEFVAAEIRRVRGRS